MKKTILFICFIILCMAGGLTVSADTDGTYVYSVSGSNATITGVADKTAFMGEAACLKAFAFSSFTNIIPMGNTVIFPSEI